MIDAFDEILANNKDMITMGDININLLSESKVELMNVIASNNTFVLNQNESSYTRRDAYSLSIIDHICTDCKKQFVMQLGESVPSDHIYVLLLVKNMENFEDNTLTKNKYINYVKIRETLETRLNEKPFENFSKFHKYISELIALKTQFKSKPNVTTYLS